MRRSAALIIGLVLGLSALQAMARNGQYLFREMCRTRIESAAGASITVDMWQDFEFTGSPSATSLNSNDHCSVGSWSVSTNQAAWWTTTEDEKTTTSSVNGTADAGTRGLRRSMTNASTSYVEFTLPAAKTNISVGFWWRAPDTPAWAGEAKIVYAYFVSFVKFVQLGTAGQPRIALGVGGGGGSNSSPLVPGSWYWITASFVKNGTCSCTVYDSTGAEITTQPGVVTGLNNNISSVLIGDSAHLAANAYSAIDDVVLDWTTATYPLGP